MKLAQYEREKVKMARKRELDMLARLRRFADPVYVVGAAGYWLRRWHRSRSVTMGRKRSAA